MSLVRPSETRAHRFEEVEGTAPYSVADGERLSLRDLGNVCLSVTADLGQSRMLVRDVLGLKAGSVVALDRLAGEMADIYVNEVLFARGEVVVIGDSLHVRVGEILGASNEE